MRDQHAHTTTWLPSQPPDAVVMAQTTADIQDVVRICAERRVPVIPFGTGTSLEGQVNAPAGGVCIDLREMNHIIAVHPDDLDCVIEPGVTRRHSTNIYEIRGCFPDRSRRGCVDREWLRRVRRAPITYATAL